MTKYFDECKRAMEWLGEKQDTYFIGQSVGCPGTALFNTVKDIDPAKRLELPVIEETQAGMTLGMALNGSFVVSIFPRWNFLCCATNQLVNHLDKIGPMSNGEFKPRFVIRTAVGSERPLDPQHQHKSDFTEAYKLLLENIEVIKITEPEQIFEAYKKAYERQDNKNTLIVEVADFYNEK